MSAAAAEKLFYVLHNSALPATADVAALGSKAWGLTRLVRQGLRVPPAFVLGTAVCRDYFAAGERLSAETHALLRTGLARLAEASGQHFGGARRPLLVAVRSGAPVSMPGMMDTLLNVGLCEQNLPGFLRSTGNPRLVYDCYRRLIRDFTTVVRGAAAAPFDALLERRAREEGLTSARELDTSNLAEVCNQSLETAIAISGRPFPQEPIEQLEQAVEAVFRSWQSERARHYRQLNGIDDSTGTAITVQAMVFGNSGNSSGAGVGFTRDPSTGTNELYIDFLFNAQGEDVVSGRHAVHDAARLGQQLPVVAQELQRLKPLLEEAFRDMQDFEFTVSDGRLYLLQTRAGKRTPWAAVRIATDMVREGLIGPTEGLAQLRGLDLQHLERTRLAEPRGCEPLASGVAASIGVAAGGLAFDSRRAAALAAQGEAVILARREIETTDIEGIAAAQGILTAAGGRTSHAAVVARQLGKVCVVGCPQLTFEPGGGACTIAGTRLPEGEPITLDGETGAVYRGLLPLLRERPEHELAEIEGWRREATAAAMSRRELEIG